MCVFVVSRHKQRYFSYKCDGTDVQADTRRSLMIVWGKLLYLPVVQGDRQLYSSLSIDILPYNQLSGGKVTI